MATSKSFKTHSTDHNLEFGCDLIRNNLYNSPSPVLNKSYWIRYLHITEYSIEEYDDDGQIYSFKNFYATSASRYPRESFQKSLEKTISEDNNKLQLIKISIRVLVTLKMVDQRQCWDMKEFKDKVIIPQVQRHKMKFKEEFRNSKSLYQNLNFNFDNTDIDVVYDPKNVFSETI